MRGHNDICLPACGSIRNTSVGCSCPGTGRQGNPFLIIENSFSSFIENDICASQESRSLGLKGEDVACISVFDLPCVKIESVLQLGFAKINRLFTYLSFEHLKVHEN